MSSACEPNIRRRSFLNFLTPVTATARLSLSFGDSGEEGWLGFDPLTLIPIQKSLIDLEILNDAERKWVDDYHGDVWERVGGRMDDGTDAKEWLWKATRPL